MILKDRVFVSSLCLLLRRMERKIAYVVTLEGIYLEHDLLHLRALVIDNAEAILEVFGWFQVLRHLEYFV